MKKSIFTISVWVKPKQGSMNPPSWETTWEGEDFPTMLMKLGTAKEIWSRVRLDWRDEDAE